MEISRKQLLVAFVVVIGNIAKGFDLVFGILVLFVFFALHTNALPYKRGKHNFLKAAEMFAEYMTLFLTLLLLLAQVRCDCAHGLRLAHDRLGCLQSVLFCVVSALL